MFASQVQRLVCVLELGLGALESVGAGIPSQPLPRLWRGDPSGCFYARLPTKWEVKIFCPLMQKSEPGLHRTPAPTNYLRKEEVNYFFFFAAFFAAGFFAAFFLAAMSFTSFD